MAEITLPLLYLQLIGEQLRAVGASVEAWLVMSGLRADALVAGIPGGLTFEVFQKLVLNSESVSREPAMGLFVGERLEASTHGFLGYAALSSATVGGALDVLERFMGVRTSVLSMRQERRGRAHRVCFVEPVPLGTSERSVLEAVTLRIKNMLDAASFGGHAVDHVAFAFADPGYRALAEEMFGCEVRYEAGWSGLSMPEESLGVRLKLADPKAREVAAELCQRELEKSASEATWAARVRRVLLEKQNGFPSLQATSRRLHVTPRTLHRRLVSEGTSFRALLEEVRRALAVGHLQSGRFSVEEVGYILGYENTANFRRAFKRWESVPPSHFLPG